MKKNNCYNCKHRRELSYSAHSRCTFKWAGSGLTPPKVHEHGVRSGWWFPFNYDPVWQKEQCAAHENITNDQSKEETT